MDTEKEHADTPNLVENVIPGIRLKVTKYVLKVIRMFVQRLKKPLQVRRSKELKRRLKRHHLASSI